MTTHDIELIGARVKAFRQKRGYTQAQLSELVDCSNTYICYIEKGSKCMSLEMFVLVAKGKERICQDHCIEKAEL